MAEKFETIVKRERSSSRMKDYYDLYFLILRFKFEGEKLYECLEKTFLYRKTVIPSDLRTFSLDLLGSDELQVRWKNFLIKNDIEIIEFSDCVNTIASLMNPILFSILEKEKFNKSWLPSEKIWR